MVPPTPFRSQQPVHKLHKHSELRATSDAGELDGPRPRITFTDHTES